MFKYPEEIIERIKQRINFQTLFLGAVIALTLYIVLTPLYFLIWNSFHLAPSPVEQAPLGLRNYIVAYFDISTWKMFVNTLWFTMGSVSIGLTLGVIFAWLLERTNIPLKVSLYALVPLPMIIPGMLSAIAWILLLSPRIGVINLSVKKILGLDKAFFDIYTIYGMFFVEGLRMVPTMFLMMVGAFRSMDPSLEEAGATSGSNNWDTARRITFPLMLPAILSAAMYSFTGGIQAFAIPGVIGLTAGIQVFSTKIFLATRSVPVNYSLASTYAVIFVVISAVVMVVYSRVTKRVEKYATITGKGYRPRVIDLGVLRYVAAGLIMLYVFLALILPTMILIWGSLRPFYQVPTLARLKQISLEAYRSALGYPQIYLALKNTVMVMLASATLNTLLGSLISWIVVRTKMRGRNLFDVFTFLPHGVPSTVIGLALLIVYLRLDFIPIYGTLWIIILAFCTRYMTFSVRTMNAAMRQIHGELEEAASASGATWSRMFLKITMPLLAPSLVSVWVWTAMHGARELSAAIMLSSPGTTVLSVIIWDLWEEGMVPETCVMGVFLIFFMAIVMILGRIYGFRAGQREG
ncbi:MAG: iron ABC transporter permease [Desulfobacterales bacterium]|nr:iron ABC transporter permease [Desulfobacterales bacterium]